MATLSDQLGQADILRLSEPSDKLDGAGNLTGINKSATKCKNLHFLSWKQPRKKKFLLTYWINRLQPADNLQKGFFSEDVDEQTYFLGDIRSQK